MDINNFLKYISFEKRYSDNTLIAYKKDLEQFFEFAKDQYNLKDLEEINHQIIRSWMVGLAENKLSSKSINRKLSALKSYYKFLLKENIVSLNPMVKIIAPKTNKRLPEFVDVEKMDILLDEIDFGDDFAALRNKLIIEIFYFTGMRLAELVNMKNKDVDIYGLQIKVLGKRNKERMIPFSNQLKDSIQNYEKKGLKQSQILSNKMTFSS